jgi:RNA polymerase-associated protein CTR9
MDGGAHTVGRTIDIELGGQEVITIDLDVLDTVDEILDLLSDPQCRAKAWVWAAVATEFWRRGSLEAAEKVATAAVRGTAPIPSAVYTHLGRQCSRITTLFRFWDRYTRCWRISK